MVGRRSFPFGKAPIFYRFPIAMLVYRRVTAWKLLGNWWAMEEIEVAWLDYIVDYTTHVFWDYKRLEGAIRCYWLVGLYRGWNLTHLYWDYNTVNHDNKDPYEPTSIMESSFFLLWLWCQGEEERIRLACFLNAPLPRFVNIVFAKLDSGKGLNKFLFK